MSYTVKKHDLGYYFISPVPSEQELSEYYKNKYYQDLTATTYQATYTEEELAVLQIDAELSNYLYNQNKENKSKKLFDVGCGEGFFMKSMQELGWEVSGTDFSSYGIKLKNPELEGNVFYGDLNSVLDHLIQNNRIFDFINLGNILEHVISPILILNKCHKLLSQKGVLRVKVPNDFSYLQEYLTKDNLIKSYWVHPPDHLSYFNFDSLPKILNHCNFNIQKMLGDFPIELFLLHPESNYVNKNVGKQAHQARIDYTLDLWKRDSIKYIETFTGLAKAKISRSCIAYANKKKMKQILLK